VKFNRSRSAPPPEPDRDNPSWVPQPVERWIEPEEVAERLRRRRGRWRALRHSLVLLLVILVVGGVGVVAGGAVLGRWALPWSPTPADVAATAAPTAPTAPTAPLDCERAGVVPAGIEGTSVAVLNATSRPGLAGTVGDELETRGFTVAEVGNYSTPVAEAAVVLFPEGAEPAALAVGLHLQGAVLRFDPTVAGVTAVVGDAWEGPNDAAVAAEAARLPQPSVVTCADGSSAVAPPTPTG